MSLFDIIHVEDSLVVRKSLEEIFQSKGLTTYGLGYLDELKTALAEGHRARLYITDGDFPKRKGDDPSYLAETAILEIRKADPQARIVVFSLYGSAKNSADKHGIPYFNKAQGSQLADYVSRELSSKQPQ